MTKFLLPIAINILDNAVDKIPEDLEETLKKFVIGILKKAAAKSSAPSGGSPPVEAIAAQPEDPPPGPEEARPQGWRRSCQARGAAAFVELGGAQPPQPIADAVADPPAGPPPAPPLAFKAQHSDFLWPGL